jgi:hypothetical protein
LELPLSPPSIKDTALLSIIPKTITHCGNNSEYLAKVGQKQEFIFSSKLLSDSTLPSVTRTNRSSRLHDESGMSEKEKRSLSRENRKAAMINFTKIMMEEKGKHEKSSSLKTE